MEYFKYKYDELFNPLLEALHNLGGSGSISEIEEEVAGLLNLTDKEVNDIHKGTSTKIAYRLAWARNYLKRYDLIENSSRGIWSLTHKGQSVKSVDKEDVKKTVRDIVKKQTPKKKQIKEIDIDNSEDWKSELINVLKSISPDAFERLCKRLLRELGFVSVEVTGKSGDGGIDGKGIMKIASVLSFHVVFQAKRWKGTVSPSVIRDFRGAMMGKAEKGIILTTGNFSREAKKESIRDGATPIDLIDGDDFAEKLKELRLGLEVETHESVQLNQDWFENI